MIGAKMKQNRTKQKEKTIMWFMAFLPDMRWNTKWYIANRNSQAWLDSGAVLLKPSLLLLFFTLPHIYGGFYGFVYGSLSIRQCYFYLVYISGW